MQANKQSILWKISQANHPTSYLFGSMHVMDQRAFSKVDSVQKYMSHCESFYTEIDLESASGIDPNIFKLPNQKTLIDYTGVKKYEDLKKVLKKYFNFHLEYHDKLLPLLLINKIAEHILQKEQGQPLDSFLWMKAKELGLETKGLETIEDQIKTLNAIPLTYQVQKLKQLKRSPAKFKKQILQLMDWYECESINLIYQQTKNSLGGNRKVMLYSRNKMMSNGILENIQIPSFYVVGAAHLAGNYGVIAYLKRAGLRLQALFN